MTVGADFLSGEETANPSPPPRQDRANFLGHTRRFWQERTSRALDDEDAREIVTNVSGFFELLAKWNQGEGRRRKATSPTRGVRPTKGRKNNSTARAERQSHNNGLTEPRRNTS